MAGIDLSGLVAQAGKELQAESIQPMLQQLDALSVEINSWLGRAKRYVELQNSEVLRYNTENNIIDPNLQKKDLNIGTRASNRLRSIQYDALEAASTSITDRSILFEGYELLNRLGESARGEGPINYSVTITGSGVENPFAITWEVDYETFKQLTTTSRTRIIMADPSSIMQTLSTVEPKANWNSEMIKIYNEFHEWANIGRENKLLNKGNTLEAFLRLQPFTNSLEQLKDKNNWQTVLNETLSNSLPFYGGGDIGNIQVKGMYASVTNLGTLINALARTQTNINKLKNQIIRLSEKPPKTEKGIANLNKSIEKSILKILTQYGFSLT